MVDPRQALEGLSDAEKEKLRQTEERLNRAVLERRKGNKVMRGARHYEQAVGSLTFRYETVRCGKKNCSKCPHGPYWYAYWKENGRTRSRYVGRLLPLRAQKVQLAKQDARLNRKRVSR